jgi:hypothetical protein
VRILQKGLDGGGGQLKQIVRENAARDDNNYVDHANEYQNVFRFLERRNGRSDLLCCCYIIAHLNGRAMVHGISYLFKKSNIIDLLLTLNLSIDLALNLSPTPFSPTSAVNEVF